MWPDLSSGLGRVVGFPVLSDSSSQTLLLRQRSGPVFRVLEELKRKHITKFVPERDLVILFSATLSNQMQYDLRICYVAN